MKDTLAVRYHEHGKASEVLKLETIQMEEPRPSEVVIAMRAAVIHPSDFGMIAGSYGRLKELPAVAGREGVGEIVQVGSAVSEDLLRKKVRMPEQAGVWKQVALALTDELTFIPSEIDAQVAAQAFVNPPTAYRLLNDFVDLSFGNWIIQNAGNSAVGFCVAGYAKHLGINCISVVRDVERWEQPLKDAGSTAVIAEGTDYFKSIKDITDGVPIKLALNSIGGDSVMSLIKAVDEGGTVVTFGGMVGDKVRFPTRELIFKDIALRGFWMDRWYRNHADHEANSMMTEIYKLLKKDVMQLPVDQVFAFENALEAIQRASEGNRQGKVLITSDWQP
ncbi:2-enoyl thioester reductase domain-containing protein [Rubellicoccus peritrichatus]|uniref:enoyl-[acyl-carrier-protein] reductase n=1 Tax=Rubellicoccus peritrichatus TaxID=3080537 RepID=A0AAQ3L943_9BACT|nr:2-enoyl thioester reductase domain-containing protein [Puniceicoccus sp. CR14]WOO40917.1 2-enoyl thioester reductase domain-containing protein [Puniceicoccus sp. CR14]